MSSMGGVEAGRLRVVVVSDTGTLDADLEREVNKAVTKAGAAAERGSKSISAKMRDAGKKASLFLTAPILALGAVATQAASDTIEQTNKANVVFGEFAGEVTKYADTSAKAVGISRRAALEAAGTFGNLFRAMGIGEQVAAKTSTTMVSLAGDLASFNNAKPEEVLDALRAGLIGEAEPLRRFGIQLSEARVEAEAFAIGLVKPVKNADALVSANLKVEAASRRLAQATKEHGKGSLEARTAQDSLTKALEAQSAAVKGTVPPLTDAQKVQARQSIILKDSALAQGDFSRSLNTSLANQQRVSAALADDAKATLGANLIPLVQKGTIFLGKLAAAFSDMSPQAQKAVLIIAGAAAALGPVLTVLGNVQRAYKGVAKAAGLLSKLDVGPKMLEQAKAAGSLAKSLATAAKEYTVATAKAVAHRVALIAQSIATNAVALATKAWTAIQALFNIVMSANPIVLVAIAIAALVAGIIIAYRESETFRAIVQAVFGAIAGAVKAAVDFVIGTLQAVGAFLAGAATAYLHAYVAVWRAIFAVIVGVVKLLWAGITATFSAGKAVVLGIVNAVKAGVLLAFDGIKAVGAFLQGVWDGWVRIFRLGRDAVVNVAKSIVSGVTAVFNGMGRAFDGLKDAVRAAINFIIRGWNRLEFSIPGFDPPGPGPKFGGFTLGVPDIPELGSGAIIRARPGGTVVRVGEGRHDEIVGPMDADMRDRLGIGGGGGMVFQEGAIQVHNPTAEPASQSVNTRLRRLAVLGPPTLAGKRG